MNKLAYELRDEFNKRPNESSEVIIKDVYEINKSLVNNIMKKSSISEDELLEFVKTYKNELKEYYNPDELPNYTFTLDDGRILSIQGSIIGIDDPTQNEDIIALRGYYNISLPTAYPNASGTYVQKGFLSLWQINEWSEGGSMHFQTILGEAGLKCNKTGYVWTYSYY